MNAQALLTLGICFAIVGCFGCGASNTTAVTGSVTFEDGSPLTSGTIIFENSASSSSADIQSDGSFTMGTFSTGDGVVPGTYGVAIASYGGGDEVWDEASQSYKRTSRRVSQVEESFTSPRTSGLTAEVKPGNSSTLDFVVRKPR
ncbi:hypothetical protein [Bremerella alba]|uniref:Carboxypeptidase regulatory-like domain-containing protein n=1 Tax=Bremerella alba TaxID=980252 RepID=A0A7V8V4D8_9BACT|nr:hypothetical protein [Bremerella alba]MBA2114661.1 hypothetical protein [Bremerella alba]